MSLNNYAALCITTTKLGTGGPVVKDLLLSLLEPWFQFLVEEAKFHKLNGTAKKKKRTTKL